jgi:hypothetical protein
MTQELKNIAGEISLSSDDEIEYGEVTARLKTASLFINASERLLFADIMKRYSERKKLGRTYPPVGKFFADIAYASEKSKPILEALYIVLTILLDYTDHPFIRSKINSSALIGNLIYAMFRLGLITKETYEAYKKTKNTRDPANAIRFEERITLLTDFRAFVLKDIGNEGGKLPTALHPQWKLFLTALTTEDSKLRKSTLNTAYQNTINVGRIHMHALQNYVDAPRSKLRGKQRNLSLGQFILDVEGLKQKRKEEWPFLVSLFMTLGHYPNVDSSVLLPILLKVCAEDSFHPENKLRLHLEELEKFSPDTRSWAIARFRDLLRPKLANIDGLTFANLETVFSAILSSEDQAFRQKMFTALLAYFDLSTLKHAELGPNIQDYALKVALCPSEHHTTFKKLFPKAEAAIDERLRTEITDLETIATRLPIFANKMRPYNKTDFGRKDLGQTNLQTGRSLVELVEACRSMHIKALNSLAWSSVLRNTVIPNLRAWLLIIDYYLDPQNEKKLETSEFIRTFIDAVGFTLNSTHQKLDNLRNEKLDLLQRQEFLKEFKTHITKLSPYELVEEKQAALRPLCKTILSTKTKDADKKTLLGILNATLLALSTGNTKELQPLVTNCDIDLAPFNLRALSRERSDVGSLFPEAPPQVETPVKKESRSSRRASEQTSGSPFTSALSPHFQDEGSPASPLSAQKKQSKLGLFGAKEKTPEQMAAAVLGTPEAVRKRTAEAEKQKLNFVMFPLNKFAGKKGLEALNEEDSQEADKLHSSDFEFSVSRSPSPRSE